VTDEILFTRAHPDAPFTSATLCTVSRDGGPLDVAGIGDGDRHVLVGNQVLDPQLARFFDDHGTALVAVLLTDFSQFVQHHLHQQFVTRQDGAEPFDRLQQFGQLVDDLLPLQSRQALQLHVENRLRLKLRELEFGHQTGSGLDRTLRGSDQRNDAIQVIQRDLETLEDMGARFGFAKLEFGAPANDLAPELDEVLEDVEERQYLGAPADDGEHDDAERRL